MFEIFGLQLSKGWYIVVFTICQLINVALNTAKTIIMHKEKKISSSIINALTYGFYAIIVVMTASALPLLITIIITAITNLIGVYGSMWVLERFKKDSLWEIVATIDNSTNYNLYYLQTTLQLYAISYNYMQTNKQDEYVFHIYSKSQKESTIIKEELNIIQAKYIVHEERVKL